MKQSLSLFLASLSLLLFMGCQQAEEQPAADQLPEEITVYAWSEYFDEAVFTLFEEQTGIRVIYKSHDNPEEMEAQVRSRPGAFDVLVIDNTDVPTYIDTKLLSKIDHSLVPNLKNVDHRHLNLSYDKENQFSAPYLWGTTLIAYRKDHIESPAPTWNILFGPKYSGKAMFIGDRMQAMGTGLLSLGIRPNLATPEQVDTSANRLANEILNNGLRFGGGIEVIDALVNNDIWVGVAYSGDAAAAAAEHEFIDYFIPEEGALIWVDNFTISRTSTKTKAAHMFINFLLEPKIAAMNSNATFFASTNKAAIPFLKQDLLEDPTVYPPQEVMDKCFVYENTNKERVALANKGWHHILQSHASLKQETPIVAGDTDVEE